MKKRSRKKKSAKAVREPIVAFEPAPDSAKLFMNGRSQAVRLPREFRFEGDEVLIRKSGDAVILEPVRPRRGWPAGFWERLGGLGPDFEAAVLESRHATESAPPDLDTL